MIVKNLFSKILGICKSKKLCMYLAIFFGGLTITLFGYKYYKNCLEIERLKNNNRTLASSVMEMKTRSGETFYKVNSTVLTNKELKQNNRELYDELKDMKIKFKQTQNVSKLNYSYNQKLTKVETKYITDTIYVPTTENHIKSDTLKYVNYSIAKFNFKQKSDSIKNSYILNGTVNIPITNYVYNSQELKVLNSLELPYLSNIEMSITDDLLVVPVINYKRFLLFFKRPISVTVNIKSSSNIFKLNQAETYQIK